MTLYQPLHNTTTGNNSENFRLLSITESTDENDDKNSLKQRKSNTEDLKLTITPSTSSNKVMSAAGKIRRKIRLKRKQRDRMNNGIHNNLMNNTSTSETGEGSEMEDDMCSPVDACLSMIPSCCCCSGRRRYTTMSSRAHRHVWLNAFVLFIFAVALASLAYYTMTLQNQLAVLSIHLDPVLDDKSSLEKSQEDIKTKLTGLIANQSILHNNLTKIFTKVERLNTQVSILNGSIANALEGLAGAPELKNVPDKILKMSQELGQFGSRLTGIEAQVKAGQDDLVKVQNSLQELPSTFSKTSLIDEGIDKGFIHNLTSQFDEKLHNETSILDEKINTFAENFKLLGMNLTEQIQKQELHASKSWKLLDRLNNDIQNVSAKAASNELISRNNQAQIAKLQLESTDKNQNIVKKDGEARSQNPDVQEPKA